MVNQKKHRVKGLLFIYFLLSILFDVLAQIVLAKHFSELPIGGVRLVINGFAILIVLGVYKFVLYRQQFVTNIEETKEPENR